MYVELWYKGIGNNYKTFLQMSGNLWLRHNILDKHVFYDLYLQDKYRLEILSKMLSA